MARIVTLKEFAELINDTLESDRDAVIGWGGMTGGGKSVGIIQTTKEFCKIRKQTFSFDCMTWERAELLEWVDGTAEDEPAKYGGQKPEYSANIADELISMFYARNWYEEDQKAAVELFNKCRDRHQLIQGAVPNFWDLDSGLLSRFRFYVFVPYRGIAWVFQQENNPFTKDQWNVRENSKVFRKHKNPYKCPNFAFEFRYDDLDAEEKKAYYDIRNTKRKNTENQNKKKTVEKYGKIKGQRDEAIRLAYETGNYTQQQIADRCDICQQHVADVCNGVA